MFVFRLSRESQKWGRLWERPQEILKIGIRDHRWDLRARRKERCGAGTLCPVARTKMANITTGKRNKTIRWSAVTRGSLTDQLQYTSHHSTPQSLIFPLPQEGNCQKSGCNTSQYFESIFFIQQILLNTYYMPGTMYGGENVRVNKIDKTRQRKSNE